jgi:hypothetical protein
MANPHPRPFDRAARDKAAADLARMDHMAALNDCRLFAEHVRDTSAVQAREADRLLRHLDAAYAEALGQERGEPQLTIHRALNGRARLVRQAFEAILADQQQPQRRRTSA